MLLEISAGGIAAYCADLIVHPAGQDGVCFISLAGPQAAVKGLLANLLEGASLTVMPDGRFRQVRRLPNNYHMKVRKLPSGLAHGLAFPKSALPSQVDDESSLDIFLIGRDPGRLQAMLYRHVELKTDLPLHPSWTAWLWRQCLEKKWVRELRTLVGSFSGFAGNLDQAKLQGLIGAALTDRDPEISSCMRQSGRNISSTTPKEKQS